MSYLVEPEQANVKQTTAHSDEQKWGNFLATVRLCVSSDTYTKYFSDLTFERVHCETAYLRLPTLPEDRKKILERYVSMVITRYPQGKRLGAVKRVVFTTEAQLPAPKQSLLRLKKRDDVTIDQIITTVAQHYCISSELIRTKVISRPDKIHEARRVSIYLVAHITPLQRKPIAAEFGDLDPSAISRIKSKVEADMMESDELRAIVQNIADELCR